MVLMCLQGREEARVAGAECRGSEARRMGWGARQSLKGPTGNWRDAGEHWSV